MKHILLILLVVLIPGLAACSCENTDIPQKIGPGASGTEKTGKKPGSGAKNKLPVMGSYQILKVPVEELSGLCLNKDQSGLWAVGDEGALCAVSFTGNVTPVFSSRLDLEGITLNPATGDLLLAVEGDQMVCRLSASDYKTLDTLFYVKEALERDFDNSGLEGITFYKDSLLMVGSQEDALLWTYRFDGTLVSRISLLGETSLIEEIAGLCYDPVKDWLWVTDSDAQRLFIFSAGEFDLVASYAVPFIDNAESICVDRARNCVWVGSDEDSPKLYKISFTF